MAYTFIAYDSEQRAIIKAVFGNRTNWNRFCSIANQLAAEIALRIP